MISLLPSGVSVNSAAGTEAGDDSSGGGKTKKGGTAVKVNQCNVSHLCTVEPSIRDPPR